MKNARIFLRVEALAFLLLAVGAYYVLNYSWVWFFVLLLVPDITMLGYLMNSRVGAWVYNIGHTYALPLILLVLGVLITQQFVVMCALIWFAHIAIDRIVGFGLKHEAFSQTHLGSIGRHES